MFFFNQPAAGSGRLFFARYLLVNIRTFIDVELIIFALLRRLLGYFPRFDYFTGILKSSLTITQKAGNPALGYDWLIISFFLTVVLDMFLNKREIPGIHYPAANAKIDKQ